jgi:acetyl esterase/lipase
MNPRTAVLVCLILLALPSTYALAQQPSQQTKPPVTQSPPQRSMREIVNMPVVYRVPGMNNVIVKSDLKYTATNDPNLLMDVYIPPRLAKAERRPAVVFIHGGAGVQFKPKDWGFYRSWGRLIAASGMIAVTFTHRLGYPKPLLAEAASDVTSAINYVRANAGSLNIDKERLCLAAYSAGGPMLSVGMRDKPDYVRCLVAFYAFLDIQQSEPHRTNESSEMVKRFSPITYLANDAGKLAPMFIARAGLDEVPTMNDSIDRFVREAISKNASIILVNHPQGVHGFDNQTDDERSREIIRSAIDFMKIHLGVLSPSELPGRRSR